MAGEKSFLHFNVSGDLLKAIDDWRFKNQFASRAAAIAWLLQFALKQNPKRG